MLDYLLYRVVLSSSNRTLLRGVSISLFCCVITSSAWSMSRSALSVKRLRAFSFSTFTSSSNSSWWSRSLSRRRWKRTSKGVQNRSRMTLILFRSPVLLISRRRDVRNALPTARLLHEYLAGLLTKLKNVFIHQ
jgi:hypothetical protein